MRQPKVKPVLLHVEQIEQIRRIQETQRQRSGMGVAPSIHEIARGLVALGLESVADDIVERD